MAIQEINDTQFVDHLENNEKVAMLFYADWCGSCRLFKPKFEQMSEDDSNEEISFVKINAEHNPKARQAVGVDNLPYFAVFHRGELVSKQNTTNEEDVQEMLHQIEQSHAN